MLAMEYAREFYKKERGINIWKGTLDIERVANGLKLTWDNDHDLATLIQFNWQNTVEVFMKNSAHQSWL